MPSVRKNVLSLHGRVCRLRGLQFADSVVCSLQSSVCSLQSARLIIDCPVDMYCARHLSDISFSVHLHFFFRSDFAFTHPIHLWAASEGRAALLLGSSALTFMWRPCFFGQTMKYLKCYFLTLFLQAA